MQRRAGGAALAALFAFCVALISSLPDLAMALDRQSLQLETSGGPVAFTVEIAATPSQQQRGLMFRQSLAPRAGMLFIYKPAREIQMWMRNTYIPLDMIFIAADGTVHRIEHDTEPFSERIIASRGDVIAVLEVNAGVAHEIGLKPGDKVRHPALTGSD